MIQRIQSVYLFLVTVLLVVAMCTPVGRFVEADGVTTHVFNPSGLTMADGTFQSTWGLLGILLICALISLCTIFLYRNRMLQIRMTVFGALLLIGYYVVFGVFLYALKDAMPATNFRIAWTLSFPLIGVILDYLAFRAIYRDEIMVKAADRLR